MTTSVMSQIDQASQKGLKTYQFNEQHPNGRLYQYWFQNSADGLTLFVIFYTQACRWSQCLGCNLPSVMSKEHVAYRDLVNQIDELFETPEIVNKFDKIRKIIISNNGSVLDDTTFPTSALTYLFMQLNLCLPYLDVCALETRPEYVDAAELEILSRILNEGDTPTILEVCVGFEIFDCDKRNTKFLKGLTLPIFETFVASMAKYGFRIKCYFMLKPLGEMSDAEAVDDIRRAICYLADLSAQHDIAINMHLNPTYAATGTELERLFQQGRFRPPTLELAVEAVLQAEKTPVSIYVGLYDEGLATPGGSFRCDGDEDLADALEIFNATQNFQLLHEIRDGQFKASRWLER